MTMTTNGCCETVNKLTEVCHDGELGFAAAAGALADEDQLLKSELLQYSWQWREFANQLDVELSALGEKSPAGGTVVGAVHRGWMNLKQIVAANRRAVVLVECERGENAAANAYWEAISGDRQLPKPIMDLIDTQYQAVKRVRDRISALCEAVKSAV